MKRKLRVMGSISQSVKPADKTPCMQDGRPRFCKENRHLVDLSQDSIGFVGHGRSNIQGDGLLKRLFALIKLF